MPEIAEVETVRNTLKNKILGKRIKDIEILYPKMIETDIQEFKTNLIGNKFIDIKRRGKWLIFELENYCLLSHLRMEGKFFLKNSEEDIVKHEHIIITFDDNTDLRYHDTRKFGKMSLVKINELDQVEALTKQGIEPNDPKLTKEYLYTKINNKKIPIKTILLDQTIISGLGNIYANEVLYRAKINPKRLGSDITIEECQNIIDATNEIISEAIKQGGTTIKSYTSSLGVTGRFQQYLKVHKKEGEKCTTCNNIIKNIKIGGRSTYYCEDCQI